MVLGFIVVLCFIHGYPVNLSEQFPSLERDTEHWTQKKKSLFWVCTFFPVFVLENFFVMYTVCRFCKKRFNLLFSCFVCNYVHINHVGHSFKFGCEVNVGTGLGTAKVFFVEGT